MEQAAVENVLVSACIPSPMERRIRIDAAKRGLSKSEWMRRVFNMALDRPDLFEATTQKGNVRRREAVES